MTIIGAETETWTSDNEDSFGRMVLPPVFRESWLHERASMQSPDGGVFVRKFSGLLWSLKNTAFAPMLVRHLATVFDFYPRWEVIAEWLTIGTTATEDADLAHMNERVEQDSFYRMLAMLNPHSLPIAPEIDRYISEDWFRGIADDLATNNIPMVKLEMVRAIEAFLNMEVDDGEYGVSRWWTIPSQGAGFWKQFSATGYYIDIMYYRDMRLEYADPRDAIRLDPGAAIGCYTWRAAVFDRKDARNTRLNVLDRFDNFILGSELDVGGIGRTDLADSFRSLVETIGLRRGLMDVSNYDRPLGLALRRNVRRGVSGYMMDVVAPLSLIGPG